MDQLEQSLDLTRSACAPKFKIPMDTLKDLRKGIFDDGNAELKVGCPQLLPYKFSSVLTLFSAIPNAWPKWQAQ